MSGSTLHLSEHVVQQAAASAAQAERLRQAALTLRRLAGQMKYHPATGAKPRSMPELPAALEAIGQVLSELQGAAAARAEGERIFASRGEAVVRQIREGHEAIDQGAQVTAAAIAVFRSVLADGNDATLDAPYGHGAPRRHHPGALSTIVAERAESLARVLVSLAITKINLAA